MRNEQPTMKESTLLARTIPAMVLERARREPDRLAIVDADVSITFGALAESMLSVATWLIERGVGRGDRIGVWAPNSWQWIVSALGIQAAGAAIVPINTRFKSEEVSEVLQRSRATGIFAIGRFLDTDYIEMLSRVTSAMDLDFVVVLDGESRTPCEAEIAIRDVLTTPSSEAARLHLDDLPGDAVSDIMFTSGTTGYPKGAIFTHSQTLSVYDIWGSELGIVESDRYLVVNPFFHSFGYKAGWMTAFMKGATVYPLATFDPLRTCAIVKLEAITILPGPPTIFHTLLQMSPESRGDLSSIRVSLTGAASIPAHMINGMRSELGIDHVFTAYGMTETSGLITVTRQGDPDELVARTSGTALPGVEVVICDPAGVPVPQGSIGEIYVRGSNVMTGYFDSDEDTKEVLSEEGWLQTGDAGRLDEKGYLEVTDRIKDMYISGGFNCYPAEIENIILKHPAVREVGVVGMPDDRLGEVGAAFLSVNRSITDLEFIAWCRENMANFKVPRRAWVVDALPVTANGKVRRGELRQWMRDRLDSEAPNSPGS